MSIEYRLYRKGKAGISNKNLFPGMLRQNFTCPDFWILYTTPFKNLLKMKDKLVRNLNRTNIDSNFLPASHLYMDF